MSRRRPDPRQGHLESALRRALHVAADAIEPGADGLDQIRARITAHGAARPQASHRSWAGWRQARQDAGPAWRVLAPVGAWLSYALAVVSERFRPEPGRTGWLGWLRPAAAVGTGIFVLAAAGWAVAALPQAISSPGGQSQTPPAKATRAAHSPTSSSGAGVTYPIGGSTPAYTSTCSPSSYPGGTPTTSPSTSSSPSASPSTSPTTSPSTSPAPSGSATTTPQPSDSEASSGTDAYTATSVLGARPEVSPGPTIQVSQGATQTPAPTLTPSPTPSQTPSATTSGSPAPCGSPQPGESSPAGSSSPEPSFPSP